MKLQHQLFVKHYAKTGNATAAARAAGYSPKTAHVQGCRLLKNVKIQKAQKRMADRAKWDQDRLLREAEDLLATAKAQERVADGVSVLNLIAKAVGLLTEARHNPENRPEDMSADELQARIRQALADVERGEPEAPSGPGLADSVH
jgi:phage terminase small subunit